MNAVRSSTVSNSFRRLFARFLGGCAAFGVAAALMVATPAQAVTGQGSLAGAAHSAWTEMTDEEVRMLVEGMVSHLALEIDASPEQRERMTAALVSLAQELRPVYARMTEAGARFEQLLMAEQVDRAGLEQLRAEHVAEADRVSRIVVERLADIAETLDLSQRQALRDLAERLGALRHGLGGD